MVWLRKKKCHLLLFGFLEKFNQLYFSLAFCLLAEESIFEPIIKNTSKVLTYFRFKSSDIS